MKIGFNIKLATGIVFLMATVLFLEFILALAPQWQGSDINYTLSEDIPYYHNLSNNITDYSGGITFAIDTESSINWTNASGTYSVSANDVSKWMRIENSITGNFTINATFDNQTGFFVIPMQATNNTGGDFLGTTFEFIVNATNDFPNFTNMNLTYNMSAIAPLSSWLNASDEERHYPLFFNITFLTNCSLAGWSTRGAGNCSIFNFTNAQNTSVFMNFIPTNNDVGVYWANVSVMDAGANYLCPHSYCANSTYQENKTTYYSTFVVFNVFSSLEINSSNCSGKIFQENQEEWCLINITTKGEADSLNISTYSILRNYPEGQNNVVNTSWFYGNNTANSSSFFKTINVTVNASKIMVGNWTINFTVSDITHNESSTSQINIYVNKTLNDAPDLIDVDNVSTSISLETVINLSVYDDDLLIPDKNTQFGGFNESINYTRLIYDLTDLSEKTLSNFRISILSMPSQGTNKSTAEIRFMANSSDIGSYLINVSVLDNMSALNWETFNLTIINNTAPVWNSTLNTTYLIWEDNNTYSNFSLNVSDAEGTALTFSYTNNTVFPSFNLNSTTGVINFTPNDYDIGQHIVNITISDGYLTDTESFNFTIYNVNDNSSILSSLTVTNATFDTTHINCTEDNYTTITLWVEDDDFKIPSVQKTFYNESITVNVTIAGANTSLFNFVRDSNWPTDNFQNRTKYDAIFTPKKTDVGNYNITINVTDVSNYTTYTTFNLSVTSINHNPVLTSLTNKTSAVNRTLTYDMNVTDVEDGNDTSPSLNTNFTFSYNFINGTDFIENNQSIFNTTIGLLNVTFNSTQFGSYRLNITVNDSTGLIDFETFWIFVYEPPNITFPSAGAIFNLTENSTHILNFSANHSVGDNLTFAFYIDSINCSYLDNSNCNYTSSVLRNLTNYYGNGTSYNWSFTPNLTDQTYGLLKNLTLVVYPNSSDLANASNINTTVNFKLNITNANYPITFSGHIADLGPTAYGTPITLDLTPYFTDIDHADSYYVQNITFALISNTSAITSSFSSSWVLTLAASSVVTGLVSVNATDASSNAESNSFQVEFVAPSSINSDAPSSGGGTREVPVSLKIIMPDPTSAYKKDRIELPLTLYNDGSATLYDITLGGSVAKDGILIEDLKISFSKTKFDSLVRGQKENLTMIIDVNTQDEGTYEINVNANVRSPAYVDWGKMFLTVKEGENVMEKILFTEEFLVSNPECLELLELVNDAKNYLSQGNEEMAIQRTEEALAACRKEIEQAGKPRIKLIVENKLYRYLIVSTLIVFFVGIGFYSYKRMKLRKKTGPFIQESIKNKKYLEYR